MSHNGITSIFNQCILQGRWNLFFLCKIDIVTETVLTELTLICPGWICKTHQMGDLVLQIWIDSGSLWQLSAVILYYNCVHWLFFIFLCCRIPDCCQFTNKICVLWYILCSGMSLLLTNLKPNRFRNIVNGNLRK